ncbi:MAG: late competence development ComFB family protein [Treponema sp.]
MEEYVAGRINELYDRLMENNSAWLTCDCENCRMDSISYVLNKVKPHYVVSGRGIVYTAQMLDAPQMKADIDALGIEAIRTVAATQRPYHKEMKSDSSGGSAIGNPSFNFPIIMGTVYNGTTFEPLSDATVTLRTEDGDAAMQDTAWQNPSRTFNSTKGTFSFWPKSLAASQVNETRKFHFAVEVSAEGFTTANYGFDVISVSDAFPQLSIENIVRLKIMDLYLFP